MEAGLRGEGASSRDTNFPAGTPASQPRGPRNPGSRSDLPAPAPPRAGPTCPSDHTGCPHLHLLAPAPLPAPRAQQRPPAPAAAGPGTLPLRGLGPAASPPSPCPGPAGSHPQRVQIYACLRRPGRDLDLGSPPSGGAALGGLLPFPKALCSPAHGGAAPAWPADPPRRSRPPQECARGRGAGWGRGLERAGPPGSLQHARDAVHRGAFCHPPCPGRVEGPGLPIGPATLHSSTWAETSSGMRACTQGTVPCPCVGKGPGLLRGHRPPHLAVCGPEDWAWTAALPHPQREAPLWESTVQVSGSSPVARGLTAWLGSVPHTSGAIGQTACPAETRCRAQNITGRFPKGQAAPARVWALPFHRCWCPT